MSNMFKNIAMDKPAEGLIADEDAPPASLFGKTARTIYRYPVPFVLFMPLVCIVLAGVGFMNYQIEDEVSELWARKDSDYYHDLEYREKVEDSSSSNSGALIISKPRKGKNIMSTDFLEEVTQRMNLTEQITIEHKGETYTFDDVCYNPTGEYVFPCFRLTTLDCFEQGGYSFDETAAEAWRTLFVTGALDSAVASIKSSAVDEAIAEGFCPSECNTTASDWTDDSTCEACYDTFLTANATEQYTRIYYVSLKTAMGDTSYSDAIADAYFADAINETVNEYITTYKQSIIANSIASSFCTFDCDVSTSDWSTDSACLSCYAPLFAAMNQTKRDSTYYKAMRTTFGFAASEAFVDAYVYDLIEASVSESAMDSIVNEGVATSLCASDSGDQGYCNMTSLNWETDTDCMSCFTSFLNGSESFQTDLIYYTALRSSLTSGVESGVEDFVETATYTIIASTFCPTKCNTSKSDWTTDNLCYNCYIQTYNSSSDAYLEALYYAGMKSTYGFTTNAQVDAYAYSYVRTLAYGSTTAATSLTEAYLDAYVESAATTVLEGYVDGKTPYTFQTSSTPLGLPRTDIDNTDAVLLAAASDTCYNWDEGLVLPESFHVMTLGGTKPNSQDNVNSSNPYTQIEAIQGVYYFLDPDSIRTRVSSSLRPEGALSISKSDAEDILYEFKKKFERTYSEGWDNDNYGDVQFTAFTDDTGVVGTFGRTLLQFTADSLPLSVLCYLITAVVCSLLLGNFNDFVRSRMALGFYGSIIAVIAFSGALGFTVLIGIKLNIVQTWTLPFLMVGLGMDDMFILALAADVFFSKEENKRNGRHNMETAEHIFIEAYEHVCIPVSLTSVVNAAMFCIMTISDIPAVNLTAITAVISVVLLYLTMMTSFAAAIALDFKRQIANKKDIMCCIGTVGTATAQTAALTSGDDKHNSQTLPNLRNVLWDRGYSPMMKSLIGRAVIIFLALGMLGASAYGVTIMQVGLGLEEFFPLGSMGYRFASLQGEYFPTWPCQLNWGEVNYHDKDVQLAMIEQWESVIDGEMMTDVDTEKMWTASLAEWSIPSEYGLGYCSTANSLTDGNCGPSMDSICTGTWVENVRGSKLSSEGGVCSDGATLNAINSSFSTSLEYCPVLDLDEDNYAYCISLYAKNTTLYTVYAPGLNLEDDGYTPKTPIKISKASASSLFAYDLYTTDDYVEMIKKARKGCDESNGPRCWVSGIAFEYWEQYIDIQLWLLELSILGLIVSFIVASLFFYLGFSTLEKKNDSVDGEATPENKIGCCDINALSISVLCGLIVAFNSALSLFTVVGLSSLFGVNMAGLSAMACLMSAGFAVEFSVHVVHRFAESDPNASPVDRIIESVDALFMPTALGFISSAVGIMTLLFSSFSFVLVYFFRPLFIMLVVTFFYGIFLLPALLSFVDLPVFKLYGKPSDEQTSDKSEESGGMSLKNEPKGSIELVEKTPVPPPGSGSKI